MDLDRARSHSAPHAVLHGFVTNYNGDRDLGEALLLNPALGAEELDLLLAKCSIDLQILALMHPNLTAERQIRIVTMIDDDKLRTKAKSVLLHRIELARDTLAVLCLDPDSTVRSAALDRLRRLDDTNNNYSK